MEKQLTNEEISRVFAMYLPCTVICGKQIGWTLSQKRHPADLKFYVDNRHRIKAFEAIPLSKISDEDAIEVGKIYYGDNKDDISFFLNEGKDIVSEMGMRGLIYSDFLPLVFVYEYLKLKGYAVPLFFGVGHWANGKTAIELNIAIDATTTTDKRSVATAY